MYEERRTVVDGSPVAQETRETHVGQPRQREVEDSPRYVKQSDPVGTSIAASSLISTVVWSVVVIAVLVVAILVLLRYGII